MYFFLKNINTDVELCKNLQWGRLMESRFFNKSKNFQGTAQSTSCTKLQQVHLGTKRSTHELVMLIQICRFFKLSNFINEKSINKI